MSNTQHHNDFPAQPLTSAISHSEETGALHDSPRHLRHWLRIVDRMIALDQRERFAEAGASRRDLRALRTLQRGASAAAAENAAPDAERDAQPGMAGGPRGRRSGALGRNGRRLWSLADRGWITRDHTPAGEPTWRLTQAGEAALQRLEGLATASRERVAAAVTPEDLAVTTATLEAIAREFGWSEGMRVPRGAEWRGRGTGRGHRRGYGRGRGNGHGGGYGHGGCVRGSGRERGRRQDHGCVRAQRREAYGRGFAAGFAAPRCDH